MTRIGVVGAGIAARIHAEAAVLDRRTELIGVGGGARRGQALAASLDTIDRSLDDLADAADALVLAVPGAALEDVIAIVSGRVGAVLLESPHQLDLSGPALSSAHLLHAPVTAPALRAITALSGPHHLLLRLAGPDDARLQARRHALLLAAAAQSALVAADEDEPSTADKVSLRLSLEDGRRAQLVVHGQRSPASVELEAASDSGVVSVTWRPEPTLEIDGAPIDLGGPGHPLVDLGYVGQIQRLCAVANSTAEPWPDARSGAAVDRLIASAITTNDDSAEPPDPR